MWTPQGLYAKFLLQQPTVFFGENAVYGLSNFPMRRAAVIHGSALSEDDKAAIRKVFRGKETSFFQRSWRGEPDMEGILPTVRELEAYRPDLIIAAGGGSVIDGAKLCRVLYEAPYFEAGRTRLDGIRFRTRFIAIPTVAGSGAEASSAAVYMAGGGKEMLVSHALQPEAVVLDPRYIRALPEKKQLPMLADALAHIVEGSVSVVDNALCDILAEKGLSILFRELSKPWEEADMLRLQYAAYLGGVVQNHCLVGAAHALAHGLSGEGYAHGEAVCMLIPATIRTNMREAAAAEKYRRLCLNAGVGGTGELLAFAEGLVARAGLSERRTALYEKLAGRAGSAFYEKASADRGGRGNPAALDAAYWKNWLENIG